MLCISQYFDVWRAQTLARSKTCARSCRQSGIGRCFPVLTLGNTTTAVHHMAATSVRQTDSRGRTALHWAAHEGDKDRVKQLLRDGADVEAVTVAGSTALHIAAKAGHAGLLNRLTTPTTLDRKNSQGFTPLHMALLYKQWEAAAVLMAAGASPYGPDSTPSLECPCDDTPAPALLLKAMLADPSPTGLVAQAMRWKGSDGRTMLHRAASSGHVKPVTLLLKAGADRDAVDAAGSIPLHLAVDQGRAPLVPLLATRNNINQHRSASLRTPLHMAADRGDLPVMEALLKAGADVNAKDSRSRSPLDIAADRGDQPMVALLLAWGDDHMVDRVAAEAGDAVAVAAQLAAGARPDSYAPDGTNILALAAQKGHTRVVRVLLAGLIKRYPPPPQQQQCQGQQLGKQKPLQQMQHKPDAATGPAAAGGKQARGKVVEYVAAAVASLATKLENTASCSQLLGMVLDALGPEVAGEVCKAARQQLYKRNQASMGDSWGALCSCNHNNREYVVDALLLGWLAAEARRLVPARLQHLVPGVGTSQQHLQQQQQQQLQWHQWQQTPQQLVQEAVVQTAGKQQQEASDLLSKCAELCLQQAGSTQGPVSPLVKLVHAGLVAAAGTQDRKRDWAVDYRYIKDSPRAIAEVKGRSMGCTELCTLFLSAWVAARQKPPQGLVAPVVAAVTASQQKQEAVAAPQQQQQQQQAGTGQGHGTPSAAPSAAADGATAGPRAAAAPAAALADSLAALRLARANISTRLAGSSQGPPSAASRPGPTPDGAARQASAGGGP